MNLPLSHLYPKGWVRLPQGHPPCKTFSCLPALILSAIKLFSHSKNINIILKKSCPVAVRVSILSLSNTSSTPRSFNSLVICNPSDLTHPAESKVPPLAPHLFFYLLALSFLKERTMCCLVFS